MSEMIPYDISRLLGGKGGVGKGAKLYVKYMVSLRCKAAVRSKFDEMKLPIRFSIHGGLEFEEEVSEIELNELNNHLQNLGMVLLNEVESLKIERIINTIIEIVHYTDKLPRMSFTNLIKEYTGKEQKTILRNFSDVKGVSILQFIIIQKIERAKELLVYEDLTISEIVEILNYKNEADFINQFEKITGLDAPYFQNMKKTRLKVSGYKQS